MKQKRLTSVCAVIAMLLSLLPVMPVSAEDTVLKYERVTSVEEIKENWRYLIVGCSDDYEEEKTYYAMSESPAFGDESSLMAGYREAVVLVKNDDGTLSRDDSINSYVAPLILTPSGQNGTYYFMTESGTYLNGAYATGTKTSEYNVAQSKSLPLVNILANHRSVWQTNFRDDGTVLFKTSKKKTSGYVTVETSAYIRLHHQANNGGRAVFSGGMIDDEFIDLPSDESLTYSTLDEDNIPVKTYLYKEVCTHDDMTHFDAKESTCTKKGNIEYYVCNNCSAYFKADKTTQITSEETVLELGEHTKLTHIEALEPTCTACGNIAYTHCEECGGYFADSTAQTPISYDDTLIPPSNHSYEDGVCSSCGKASETAYFDINGISGDGSRYIFAAEYGGKVYAMGAQNEKGMTAVEITQPAEGKLYASSETVAFAEEIKNDSLIYIKIGENYLKNSSGKLMLTPAAGEDTLWSSDESTLSDSDDGTQICLVTDDGEPYFSMCAADNEAYVRACGYGERCSHPSVVYSPRIDPTCTKNGKREYRYCNLCGCYFLDEAGLEVIDKNDITLLADGALDADDDGKCDLCGKTMPVYTKVTEPEEIVVGDQYILVSEVGEGNFYALKAPETAKGEYDMGIELAAVKITAEDDGTFKFNSAYNKNAAKIELGLSDTDFSDGMLHYALRIALNNKVRNLECYGSFLLTEKAKYGWGITLNDDGSVNIKSTYGNEKEENPGNKPLSVYRRTTEGEVSALFFSASDKAYHTEKNTITINEYPIYLYRLTETGTVNANRYRLNNTKTTVNYDAAAEAGVKIDSGASVISGVEGVVQALSRDAVEYFASLAPQGEAVTMKADISITASGYTEADKETGAGRSISFTISPKINLSTESNLSGTLYDILDSSFDGSPMTVTLYTAGFEPQQIIHIKQDGTKECFYQNCSEEVMQNGEKAFTYSNMYVTFDLTEFSEIRLLETPEQDVFSILKYDMKSNIVTVSCAQAGEYTMIFADYEKDVLNRANLIVKKFDAGENDVDIPKDMSLSAGDKIFFWKSMSTAEPLCGASTIE